MKARCLPSGENAGCRSFAALRVNGRAFPPSDGTLQRSPPQEKAIVEPSGESAGSFASWIGSFASPEWEGGADRIRQAVASRYVACTLTWRSPADQVDEARAPAPFLSLRKWAR